MKVSVIIPVYNEECNIIEVIKRVRAVRIEKEIILVDDGSTDQGQAVIAGISGIKKIFHEKNIGKGCAIRSGLEMVTGDVVIIQDADLEYDPNDYCRLLKPIENGETRVVYGSRFLGGGHFLTASRWANRFLTFLTNLFFSGRLTDMETCYKVLKTDLIKKLDLKSNRFEIEPEITTKLLKRKEKILEVPIAYLGRRVGKKIGVADGLAAIINLLKWRLNI